MANVFIKSEIDELYARLVADVQKELQEERSRKRQNAAFIRKANKNPPPRIGIIRG